MALRRVSASGLINKLIDPIRSVAATPSVAGRYFNTNTRMPPFEKHEPSLDLKSIPSFGVFDPFFSPSRPLSLSFYKAGRMSVETMGGWYEKEKEDEDALQVLNMVEATEDEDARVKIRVLNMVDRKMDIRMLNPFLYMDFMFMRINGKDTMVDVMVVLEKESERRYSSRIYLPEDLVHLKKIKAKADIQNRVITVIY